MKAIILLLLTAVLQIKATPQSEWKTFVSEEAGFAVSFPGEPAGDNNESGMRYKVDLGPRSFGVVCAKEFTKAASSEMTLNNTADEFLKVCKGTLIKKSPLTLNGFPGVAIRFKTTAPSGITEARYYLVKDQLYILLTFTSAGNTEDDAKKFLNSFKLLQ